MILSACMIAKNEEKSIAKCINSYKDAVDEIIVVDTGSSDKTIEIAKSLGAMVYSLQWENDFANAKNYALSKAKGDWIIFLDADEYFEEQSSQKIRDTLKKYDNKLDIHCLTCKILNIDVNLDNKLIEESINIRVLRNIKGLSFVGNIHEDFRYNGDIPKMVFEPALIIYHTGYSSCVSEGKTRRNLEILKENQKNESKDFYKNEFYLAQCYQNLNEYEKALPHIINFLESGETFIGNTAKPFEMFFRSMIETNNYSDEYDKWLEIGEEMLPYQPLFPCCRGYKHLHKKEYTKALKSFIKGIELNNNYSIESQINFMQKNIDTIYFYIGDIFEKRNNVDEAINSYIACLQHNKYNVYALKRLLILEKNQEKNILIDFLNRIYHIEEKQDLQFLMKQLSAIKIANALAFCWDIWHKKFGQNAAYYVIALLATNRYQEVFDVLYNAVLQSKQNNEDSSSLQPYLIISALFNSDATCINKVIQVVSMPYQKIIKIISGLEMGFVTNNEFREYYNILQEIIQLTNEDIVKLFLSIQNKFSVENLKLVCELLNEWGFTALALSCYQSIVSNSPLDAEIQMKIGICYFKLSQWKKADICFQNAIKQGYGELDVHEYISWINEKL